MLSKTALLLSSIALVAGCSGSGASSDDGPAADEGALHHSDDQPTFHKGDKVTFSCSGESDGLDSLKLTIENEDSITINFQNDTYTAKRNTKYKQRSSRGPKYLQFDNWNGNTDPWQDSGSSWVLVDEALFSGKKGAIKYQVRGESFSTEYNTCENPKKD